MAQQSRNEALCRYLEDAIAAEQNFETQLRTMAREAEQSAVKQAFEQHADETRTQHERLSARLAQLGGKPSGVKSFLAHFFGMAPKTAQIGHDDAEKGTQDLMIAYAVEHSEIAMYEAMHAGAQALGDTVTAELAREIQQEERRAAEIVWALIAPAAVGSARKVTADEPARLAA